MAKTTLFKARHDTKETFVVMGGPIRKVFNTNNKEKWNPKNKLKIVTHHWSRNWMKGFDSYLLLDKLIGKKEWKNKIEFTYIGNFPEDITFENTKLISPKTGLELSNELKNYDLYITGSLNEPSGNHHIEAAMCGLPILYIESGGIPEYCNEYGVSFQLDNLEEKLVEIINNYSYYFNNLEKYLYDFNNAAKTFDEILNYSISNRELIISRRKIRNKQYVF